MVSSAPPFLAAPGASGWILLMKICIAWISDFGKILSINRIFTGKIPPENLGYHRSNCVIEAVDIGPSANPTPNSTAIGARSAEMA